MTQTFTLRKISEEDIPFLFELYNCPEVEKYMSHTFLSIKDARNYYDSISGENEEGSEPGKVYIIQNDKEYPIGIVGFDYILGPTANLTFALDPAYWHKGIMVKAINEFLSIYAKQYDNIVVRIRENNSPALKLIKQIPYSLQIELLKSSNY